MRRLSTRAFLCLLLPLAASSASGQCPNDNTYWQTTTPACPGTTVASTCLFGGEYQLINVVAGNTYTFSTCGTTTWDTQITLYNNAGGAALGFNDDGCGLQSTITWVATFTGQLRVLIDTYPCSSNSSCATLTVTCSGGGSGPSNDDPCGATALTVGTSCTYVSSTTAGASASTGPPAPTCANYAGADVWFSVVVPASGSLTLDSNTGVITDGGMALYTAPSCNGPFTQVACDDDSSINGLMPSINANGLVPGSTVYVRFWEYGGDNNGSFSICAYSTGVTPPPGGCVYYLNLLDSFGDGWGTSNVGVSINGGPYTYYTVAGASNSVPIPAMPGDVIVLNYNNSGAWQGENSYSLTLGAGAVFNSGSPPTAGISYAGTLSCNPPPAPPEDCVGSITVCSGQSFNNNTNNTGNIADLNTTSAGCLLSTERQGTWYNFTVSAGGQVAFDINPTNPLDDYDFALWGPFPPGSTPGTICPPLSAPVRCSYAAPSGTTGLNYTATDLTESASGDKWVRYLDVVAGQVYLLYISNFSQSGLAFDLNWNLQGGASLDCTILGLELVGPTASDGPAAVDVAWTALGPVNGHRFHVERAGPDGRFESIGSQHALPGSTAATYGFRDLAPLPGLNRYRLRLEDGNGDQGLSPEAAVMHGAMGVEARLVPNPASSSVWLTCYSALEGQAQIEVYDTDGRLRQQTRARLNAGTNRLEIGLNALSEGPYALRLTLPDGQSANLRMVVMR